MANESTTQVWKSGDWRPTSLNKPPYNGIKIEGTPKYDARNHLLSVQVVFIDYTYDPQGLTSELSELTREDRWVSIPFSDRASLPVEGTFTIKGEVRLESEFTGVYLRIHLTYGLESREELGFIMCFNPLEIT